MNNERNTLEQGIKELGFQATPDQIQSLLLYIEALNVTNQSFNLTRIPRKDYVTLHLLDSLTALLAIPQDRSLTIIDVGTGAGFPGVPLAALCPESHVTLLDSTAKKVKFAADTAHSCGILNCRGVHARAEGIARTEEHHEAYDVVVSRAVAAFPKLMEWLLPLVKVGGCAIAMKGSGYEDELLGAEQLVSKLGGRIERIISTLLPGTDITRYLIVVLKERKQPLRSTP